MSQRRLGQRIRKRCARCHRVVLDGMMTPYWYCAPCSDETSGDIMRLVMNYRREMHEAQP